MTRLCTALIVSLALSAPAAADVTTKEKNGGSGMGGAMISGESTKYIKGSKMRTDQTVAGKATSTIIDAGAKQMIVLDHAKREAEVYDMGQLTGAMAKIPIEDIKASFTPTGQTRQIAGATCAVYDSKVTVPMQIGKDGLTISMVGPYCLVKNGPGHAEYAALYKAIADGGFLGDPRSAKAQPAQAKAMAEMQRKMAELGVAYATEMNIKFEGGGPMAAIMAKMGGNSITSEILSISLDPIADSMFEVPAGYKVNKKS